MRSIGYFKTIYLIPRPYIQSTLDIRSTLSPISILEARSRSLYFWISRQFVLLYARLWIIRILNTAFDLVEGNLNNFDPIDSCFQIDELNEYIYQYLNNGIYRTGIARDQAIYEVALKGVFDALASLDS